MFHPADLGVDRFDGISVNVTRERFYGVYRRTFWAIGANRGLTTVATIVGSSRTRFANTARRYA